MINVKSVSLVVALLGALATAGWTLHTSALASVESSRDSIEQVVERHWESRHVPLAADVEAMKIRQREDHDAIIRMETGMKFVVRELGGTYPEGD